MGMSRKGIQKNHWLMPIYTGIPARSEEPPATGIHFTRHNLSVIAGALR
jgi:hypothetical protein